MRFFDKLRTDYCTQGFPRITAAAALTGSLLYGLGRPSALEWGGVGGYLRRASQRLANMLKADNLPVLPAQENKKPVLVFDLENVLIRHTFRPLSMPFAVQKRQFSDVFLFHVAHLYEMVSITSADNYEKIVAQLDPYGCIGYRLFLPDKTRFEPKHLNRPLENVVCLASKENEYHKAFRSNELNIGSWGGERDSKLLSVLDFLANLYFTNVSDWRKTVCSYRGKDFFSTFDRVHKSIFSHKNFLALDPEKKYRTMVKRVNEDRINEFLRAKVVMDQNVAKDNVLKESESVYWRLANAVKRVVF